MHRGASHNPYQCYISFKPYALQPPPGTETTWQLTSLLSYILDPSSPRQSLVVAVFKKM